MSAVIDAGDAHGPGSPVKRLHSRMRRAIVRTVNASALIPQFSVEYDVDCTELRSAVRHWRHSGLADVSVSDLLHAAVAHTLIEHPGMNASFSDEGVLLYPSVNLAFIVEADDGMLTPVLTSAERMSLAVLAMKRRELTAAAAVGALKPDDLLSGTFTVSNLGPLGIPRFTAMVLPPQVGILAVGSVSPSENLALTLSCDHRVVDGAPAARFLVGLGRRLSDRAWLRSAVLGEGSSV